MSALPIELTEHATDRYHERVKPTLDPEAAKADLLRLLPSGVVQIDPPEFALCEEPAHLWLMIGEGITLPLVRNGSHYIAVSCLTNAGHSDAARKAMNLHKRNVRQRRNARSSKRFTRSEGNRRKRGVVK